MKLSQVTKKLSGQLISDGEFARLDYCTVESELPFLSFMEKEKFLPQLFANHAISCVLCTENLLPSVPTSVKGIFVTTEPKATFEMIHNSLENNSEYRLLDFENEIDSGALISDRAYIYPKNVRIGKNVIIEPFAVIGEHVTIGDNCIIRYGAVVGGQSYTCARYGADDVIVLKDFGTVLLESDVEIMSLSHVARGILPHDCTYCGKNTKIDACVHIGHGARLGKRVFVAANAIIAGNAVVGDDVWIGPNATVSNRVTIGVGAKVSLGAVVTKNVPTDVIVSGNFAIEHKKFIAHIKNIASDSNLR